MKLRGRAEAPHGAEGAQFLSARGAKPQARHGPLQRLLELAVDRLIPSNRGPCTRAPTAYQAYPEPNFTRNASGEQDNATVEAERFEYNCCDEK